MFVCVAMIVENHADLLSISMRRRIVGKQAVGSDIFSEAWEHKLV
jgi:hypothetical protein